MSERPGRAKRCRGCLEDVRGRPHFELEYTHPASRKMRRRFGVDFWEREMLGRRLDWKRRYGFDATWSTTIPYMPRKPPESTI